MASDILEGPEPFDKDELDYLATNLSDEAINPGDALDDIEPSLTTDMLPALTSWIEGPQKYCYSLCLNGLSGKRLTSALWKASKNAGMIDDLSPNFIFLTVPDSITDVKKAWRSVLCTLISEISNYITHVPPKEMEESGIFGGQFARKYLYAESQDDSDDEGSDSEGVDSVDSLVELLLALRHCEFMKGEKVETTTGTKSLDYVYVVVIDRLDRFTGNDENGYLERFQQAVDQTLYSKMGAYVFYVWQEGSEFRLE
ncbi:hypothetical protein F5Y01DRAFT_325655 [Xylaria sp. FL0043]|nr:hypothetical protein F5Y01DRAFT_325655 [Xylaria sp. FL0043]